LQKKNQRQTGKKLQFFCEIDCHRGEEEDDESEKFFATCDITIVFTMKEINPK